MSNINTYSRAIVFQPDVENKVTKQIASSGRSIVNLKLVSGGGSAHIDLYDSAIASADATALTWTMDVATTGNDSDCFNYPLAFTKGIYAVLTTPLGNAAQLSIAYLPDQP